ncbi:hypothetical protein KDA_76440 [Dictyobacter alpinus]|uniref:Uncharacterized protein n=1 Tax=Dictyobacter alpinus TaxID=2014873 RepID=A0A402BLH9_9CHLR|nr:hypothetical protein [Dictyobacter alpinus]GCE32160.1 hypothetical protein KDA_76440 [Dictyobacter alpinus]
MIERLFTKSHPAEKMHEIATFVADLKLSDSQALLRVFNRGLLENMRAFGTDRAGIDEKDLRSHQPDRIQGYDEVLARMGLRLEDGIFAVPFKYLTSRFSGLFEDISIGISSHRVAIAVYKSDHMIEVSSEFFYFVNPSQKQEALAGVLVQSPLPLEQEFNTLSLEAKMNFLRENINTLNRQNIDIYLELAKDLVCFASINHLVDASARASAILDGIERREIEMNVIDECWQNLALLHSNPNHAGITKKLLTDRIHQRLCDVSIAGETEFLQILSVLNTIA